MILYFSATGNTRFAAEELAKLLDDTALDLRDRIRRRDYAPLRSERPFVICSPVYVCEPPRFLMAYLRKTPLNGNRDAYFVFTSGGYSGISGVLVRRLMRGKGMRCMGCADLTMPRNYLASDAYPPNDTAEIETRIRNSRQKLPGIAGDIRTGRKLRSRHIWLFELLITLPFNPVWCRLRQGVRAFSVSDKCISCGKCERNCPLGRIAMRDGKPVWSGQSCAHCMACIQNCPTEAIEYGEVTQGKKRYCFDRYRYAVR